MFIYNYVEMARVTGVPISFLLSRGQSIKVSLLITLSYLLLREEFCIQLTFLFFSVFVFLTLLQVLSQLLRKAKQKNLVLPNVKGQGSGQETFEGATVSWYNQICLFPSP